MFCTSCGNQIADGSSFCPKCGALLSDTEETGKIGQMVLDKDVEKTTPMSLDEPFSEPEPVTAPGEDISNPATANTQNTPLKVTPVPPVSQPIPQSIPRKESKLPTNIYVYQSAPKKSKVPLIITLIVLGIFIIGGMIAAIFVLGPKIKEKKADKAVPSVVEQDNAENMASEETEAPMKNEDKEADNAGETNNGFFGKDKQEEKPIDTKLSVESDETDETPDRALLEDPRFEPFKNYLIEAGFEANEDFSEEEAEEYYLGEFFAWLHAQKYVGVELGLDGAFTSKYQDSEQPGEEPNYAQYDDVILWFESGDSIISRSFFDFDKNGVVEMIVRQEESEKVCKAYVYTIDESQNAVMVGEFDGNCELYDESYDNGLCAVYTKSKLSKKQEEDVLITLNNGEIKTETIFKDNVDEYLEHSGHIMIHFDWLPSELFESLSIEEIIYG